MIEQTLASLQKENSGNNNDLSLPDIKTKLKEMIETKGYLDLYTGMSGEKKSDNQISVLKEMGLNLTDIIGGMKENVGIYKDLAEFEKKNRESSVEEVKELRKQNEDTKNKLLELTLTQAMDKYNDTMKEVVKKLEDKSDKENKTEKNDPMKNVSEKFLLSLLEDKFEDIKSQKNSNPFDQLFNSIQVVDTLKEKFGKKDELTSYKDIEIYKLQLEDERERAIHKEKSHAEERKFKVIEHAINTLGTELADSLGAFANAMASNNQNSVNTQTQQQGTQGGLNLIPYYCDKCGETFYLQKKVDEAPCPLCKDMGIQEEQEQNIEH